MTLFLTAFVKAIFSGAFTMITGRDLFYPNPDGPFWRGPKTPEDYARYQESRRHEWKFWLAVVAIPTILILLALLSIAIDSLRQ